jgi:CRISPR/Cas system-associated endonuclease Cas1
MEMENWLLKANINIGFDKSDGYYTGSSYVFQGSKYAVVKREKTLAKRYSTYARALSAAHKLNGRFENYTFNVVRESAPLFE